VDGRIAIRPYGVEANIAAPIGLSAVSWGPRGTGARAWTQVRIAVRTCTPAWASRV